MVALICLLIFFLQLLVLPIGTSSFETPKVIIGEVLIEILLFLALFKGKLNLRLLFGPAGLAISLLTLLTIIDLIFLRTNITFFGNSFRFQGVFLLWHLMALGLVSTSINLPNKVYPFSLFSLTVLAMSGYILGGDVNGRAFGTLGEANSLAGSAIFLLPFGLINTPKWVKPICLGLSFLIILASGSRTGVLALLIQLIFIGLVYFANLKLSKAFVLSVLLSLAILVLPIIAGGGWYENRSEIWYTSLVAGTLSPLIGHGFGNTETALHQASLILNNNIQYQFIDSAHNIFLDFWVQGGLLGVLALIIMIVFAVKQFLQRDQLKELLIILGLLTTLSFNPVSVSILIFFWWILGQGYKPSDPGSEFS